MKKGAMFGLDARIALAIFGALSVISGAALYSAIQQSKATAFLTTMQEVGKAWEQYYLDTGSDVKYQSNTVTGIYHRYTAELVSSSKDGWKGPYLPYSQGSSAEILGHPEYGNIHIISALDTTWGDDTNWYPDEVCVSNSTCYLWIHIASGDKVINSNVDIMVDGEDDPKNGNFRYRDSRAYLKYAPMDLPPAN
jgi:type II secretory pathway pseudopilin PulG